MKVGFHPVADNPFRMGYVSGWRSISDLTDRLGDLEHAVGEGRVVPAEWVPPSTGRIMMPGSLAREILLLDLHKIVLLRARRSVRSVAWDKVTLIHLFDGAVTFEVTEEPPLVVAGYKHPEDILRTIQECYKAATERILQALATQVTRPTP